MSRGTDREFLLAVAEERAIRERQRFEERKREARRERELAKRKQLREEIEQLRWRAWNEPGAVRNGVV